MSFQSALSALLLSGALLLGLAAPASAADTYLVDGSHSSIVFRIRHLNVSWFYGRFNKVTGQFRVDEANPAGSSIQLEIDADSVDTANQRRDQHLKSPDFFNAVEFPKITFRSKQVRKADEGVFEVTGDLTLHGVTREVTVRAEHVGTGPGQRGEQRAGFEAVFTIKRSDFGMSFMQGPLGDEVRLVISLEGVRQ